MNRIGAALLFTAIACSGVAETNTTLEATKMDPERFVAELTEEGVEIDQAETFSTEPVGGQGQLLCVGDQEVRVYLFASDDEASAAAARIDPKDPSNMGNVIIEWAGNPRFWQKGPMLVLYLGEDQVTEDLITAVLGQPFAQGQGQVRGLPGLPGPCAST